VELRGVTEENMKHRHTTFVIALLTTMLLSAALAVGCRQPPQKPQEATSVSDLLENPVYGEEVRVYGEVDLLGELFCPCFELISGETRLQVWYNLMTEADGTERPAVSVEGIDNGDLVIVTGELQAIGDPASPGDLWASSIEKTR
jgi:hypothetical protein